MQIGYHFQEITKEPITHTQIVRYAGASGDFNPIHSVITFAKQAGMEDVVAHGMMVKGFLGQAIHYWVNGHNIKKFSSRFKAMTKPGEKIILTGKIIDESEHVWHCIATASNQDGEVKVQSLFSFEK